MFDDSPTVPERSATKSTVPLPLGRPVERPRARGTTMPPSGVRTMTRADFEAASQFTALMTTPLAWFERDDGTALGLVLRDHRTQTFSVVTFRLLDDGDLLEDRAERIEERWVAFAALFAELA